VKHEFAPDGVLAGRYELVEEIGRGRSVVYRARDTRLGRDVAVKRVDLVGGPSVGGVDDARSRALREARASARITSPFVVGVYDAVEESDAVWLVMELVRAPSLAQMVAEQGPLDERRAALIGLGVLDALDAAHAEGIVHRDVKPGNVLVGVPDDGAGDSVPLPPSSLPIPGSAVAADVAVKLADFGVAALRDETSMTSPGAVIGSPSYMSPEQASGRPAGPPADLWALGALLYFAVEGQPPFLGDSPLATATAVVLGDPRPQERPGQLSGLIGLLLDKQPDRRPGSPRVRAILHSVAGDPVRGEATEAVVAGPLAIGPLAARPAVDPAALADSARTLDGVARPVAAPRPVARRLRWAAAAALAVVMALALQLSGGGGGSPEAEADVDADTPVAVDAPPTTLPGPAPGGATDAEPASREAPGDPVVPATTVPDTAPAAPAPSSTTTTTAPPQTTTSLPPSTTTSEPPEPDVTTPTTAPVTSTTTPTVPIESSDVQVELVAEVVAAPVSTELTGVPSPTDGPASTESTDTQG
jgi:hypothetical protein